MRQAKVLSLVVIVAVSALSAGLYMKYSNLKEGWKIKEIPYNISSPDKCFKLDSDLNEISGLSYLKKGIVMAVQDEKGLIYLLDPEREEIIEKIKFGKSGDYEGIELINENEIALLESDGTISIYDIKSHKLDKYDTHLGKKNNTEGLAYLPSKNQLLVLCKADPGENLPSEKKAIYSFDLENKRLSVKPWLMIDKENLKNKLDIGSMYLKPSGIAVHPITGDFYIIDSVERTLLLYGKNKKLKAIHKLSSKKFPQPEGLCFTPDGTLYLSTEKAKDNKYAFICAYSMKK